VQLTFSTREIGLAVGFVAARVRLFNQLHAGQLSEVRRFADLLAAMPVPPEPGWLVHPAPIRLRVEEPASGAGLLLVVMHLETYSGAAPLPLLDLGLALRAGESGHTLLRLTGDVKVQNGLVAPTLGPDLARHAVVASAEAWLEQFADVLARPSEQLAQPAGYDDR
jgi:hypothetical protein